MAGFVADTCVTVLSPPRLHTFLELSRGHASHITGIFLSVNSPNSPLGMANSPKFPPNDPPNSPTFMCVDGKSRACFIYHKEGLLPCRKPLPYTTHSKLHQSKATGSTHVTRQLLFFPRLISRRNKLVDGCRRAAFVGVRRVAVGEPFGLR